jgi:hypothetical protein
MRPEYPNAESTKYMNDTDPGRVSVTVSSSIELSKYHTLPDATR